MRKPRKTLRLGTFKALDLTFRGLHIVAIPMTEESTINVAFLPDEMEARRYGNIIVFHKKGKVPTISPWTDKKLPDEFSPDAATTPRPEATDLIIARRFNDEWTSLAQATGIPKQSRQWSEMQKAFMSGARLMLLAMEEIGETDISENVAVIHLEERKAEFEAFFTPGSGALNGSAQQT